MSHCLRYSIPKVIFDPTRKNKKETKREKIQSQDHDGTYSKEEDNGKSMTIGMLGDIEAIEEMQIISPKESLHMEGILIIALITGQRNVLQWTIPRMNVGKEKMFRSVLHDHDGCNIAAYHGQLRMVQWLRKEENGWLWSEETPICCALSSRPNVDILRMLEWLRKEACPFHMDQMYRDAAAYGNMEILKWLRKKEGSTSWNERTCSAAAASGDLKLLQWLREEGCPWDERTCHYAASNAEIEVLQWARKNGCPWNDLTPLYAIKWWAGSEKNDAILRWLEKEACPGLQKVLDVFIHGIGQETIENDSLFQFVKHDNDEWRGLW